MAAFGRVVERTGSDGEQILEEYEGEPSHFGVWQGGGGMVPEDLAITPTSTHPLPGTLCTHPGIHGRL